MTKLVVTFRNFANAPKHMSVDVTKSIRACIQEESGHFMPCYNILYLVIPIYLLRNLVAP
jgi:hypothetical protein